jgi:hypothetical protein
VNKIWNAKYVASLRHAELDSLGIPNLEKSNIAIKNKSESIEKKYIYKPIINNKKRSPDFDLGE